MAEAAFWGFVAGSSLLVGGLLAVRTRAADRFIPYVMAFGAGVLISALSFELTAEAFATGGFDAVAVGLSLGALTFFLVDRLILWRLGGKDRKRSRGQQERGAALGIIAGAVLDGIPESVAIGISLVGHSSVSIALVLGVFLSNVPESMAATTGLMKTEKHGDAWKPLVLWTVTMIASAIASAAGYAVADTLSANWIAALQAFAAGAILTMLMDTMIPEAYEESHGGAEGAIGLPAVLGFALATWLTTLD